MSLGQLTQRSAHVAAALRAAGLQPGDAVALNTPMTAEAVVALLGILLAGCVVVAVADSFAAGEIASRLRITGAKAVITQDVILRGGQALPLYARVVEAGAPPAFVLPAAEDFRLLVQLRPGDTSWQDFLSAGQPSKAVQAHVAASDDPAIVLFSSGTTGEPKAIPWSHTTPLRCAANAFFHQDVRRGDVVCWPTNMGWMLGPWLVFAALLNGATIALLHGSPQGRPFGEFVQAAHVTMLGVVPSIVKAWRASDCMHGLDWSGIRCFSSAGEASAPDDVLWLMARAGYKPVIDSCGGTEIAGSFLTGSPLQPQAPSTFSTPAIGHCPVIITQPGDGSQALSVHGDGAAVTGELAILVPALGTSQHLLNGDHAQVYFEGMPALESGSLSNLAGSSEEGSSSTSSSWFLRRHGDAFERLPGGAYRALGRLDDTMNLGGIKVSSVELERACVEGVEGVLEAAAVACPPPGGGPDQLHLFLVLRPGAAAGLPPPQLRARCQAAISAKLNPLFKVHSVRCVGELPRNASNKVLRAALRAAVAKEGASRL
ncbi:acetyl- synthetase [Chlorella sorokiniana]|uniref:Acetyl-synthetase n=1 Tax=Chlorella sorokiniana TaxID=3076 RepID=A0A2P6U077_CHLSO|nr:acetyl- synthetase [Chlorella sorokiniana]|eukprot:PRW59713.1 acetyl- synthetase [Chlorella sorokiniana]